VLAGIGAGSDDVTAFRSNTQAMANALRKGGMDVIARQLALAPNRVQLHNKDRRSWTEWLRRLRDHEAVGAADTLQHFHGTRPALYEFEAQFRNLAVPTLIVLGDEDTPCIAPSLFLKRVLPAAGLWICPRTGHAIQLEEPALFNEAVQAFIHAVHQGAWQERDPRTQGSHVFVESPLALPD
jgi:pimeloyl-ACP methyl ester carboxylesterase